MLSPKKRAKISEISMENSIYCPHNPQNPQLYEDTLPTFIYSYNRDTDQLHWTSLVTGEHSTHRVPSYTFEEGSMEVKGLEEAYSSLAEGIL
jgi:hypothetical protein